MDLPKLIPYSEELQSIADLINEQEYDQARVNLEHLGEKNLLLRFTAYEGQDPQVLEMVSHIQSTLQAMVDREPEFLDDDHVMHELERLAGIMRQVEEMDDRFLMALGHMGTRDTLN